MLHLMHGGTSCLSCIAFEEEVWSSRVINIAAQP